MIEIKMADGVAERVHEIEAYLFELPADDQRTRQTIDSFMRSWLHLTTTGQVHDGPLWIQNDFAPMSFYWVHEKTRYNGGLIYHATHQDGERTQFGTWSIHT